MHCADVDLQLILVTGAFYATELHQLLVNRAISHLLVVGVTTECCVTSTLKEANDRGEKSNHTREVDHTDRDECGRLRMSFGQGCH